MPLLGVFVIFSSGIYTDQIPGEYRRFVYSIILLCTVVLPLTLLPALHFFKMIQQITIDERRERLIPLFFATICFYIAYYLVSKFAPIQVITLFLFSNMLVIISILMVSIFWKISIHMAGIGGITALVVVISLAYSIDLTFYLAGAILLSGLLGTCRLAVKAHSMLEIVAGYLLGFLLIGGLMIQLIP